MTKKIPHAELLHKHPLEIGASNPILRTRCDTVISFDASLRELASDMQKLQRIHHGTGLAAPQIGQPIQMATTIQWKKKGNKMAEIGETVLINPIIVAKSDETFVSEESCLSLPDFVGYVQRHKRIMVDYQDLMGQKKTKEFTDYNAAVVQHEIDHLHGVLFIDKLVPAPKDYKKVKRG